MWGCPWLHALGKETPHPLPPQGPGLDSLKGQTLDQDALPEVLPGHFWGAAALHCLILGWGGVGGNQDTWVPTLASPLPYPSVP